MILLGEMNAELSQSKKNNSVTISISNSIDNLNEDTCVVCFKNVEIYSIGECDHPVCYECSTRMRVLCEQNECPICRQLLSKLIFTNTKLPYRELETKHRCSYYYEKYKIGFSTEKIEKAFFSLLKHPCPKCDATSFKTFKDLKKHVNKEHDLHYCDICIEHLKIFTFERRCYTQAELGLHRTKGDKDNRSHRGHPLCEYCHKRYLDRDELFRHLRMDHYFCHFCDADGFNEFYKDYDALAEHFRQDHFLCEEGKCATEQFIGAFRTEIDYKAHVAKEHAHLLNKHQAKQTRTLQLEITLGPRGRNGGHEPSVANMRGRVGGNTNVGGAGPNELSRDNEPYSDFNEEPYPSNLTQNQSQRSITIDAGNEQDFPSLGGVVSGPSVSLVKRLPMSMINRNSNPSGLARTKENFPALGEGVGNLSHRSQNQSSNVSVSSLVKNAASTSRGAVAGSTLLKASTNEKSSGSGMVLHVSNRPHDNSVDSKKPSSLDFPSLPTSKSKKQSKKLEEDMLPSSSHISNIAAKHRTLIDDYVSVAKPNNFQKIQMVEKEEMDTKVRKAADKKSAPKLTNEDFPSLGGSSVAKIHSNGSRSSTQQTSAQWIRNLSEKKHREIEKRKSKVAPPPILPTNNCKSSLNKTTTLSTTVNEQISSRNKKKETNMEMNGKEIANKNEKLKQRNERKTSAEDLPGFLSNVTVNSIAKSPNNLTFTTSFGESYSIVTTHNYIQPPNAKTRNQELVRVFKHSLKSTEALEEFRQISQMFRDGSYITEAYYEHCCAALGNSFNMVFPELLALLPDINKQQALYLIHSQRIKRIPLNERNMLPELKVCSTCKQVLRCSDIQSHQSSHSLNDNFPTLDSPKHQGNTNSGSSSSMSGKNKVVNHK